MLTGPYFFKGGSIVPRMTLCPEDVFLGGVSVFGRSGMGDFFVLSIAYLIEPMTPEQIDQLIGVLRNDRAAMMSPRITRHHSLQ
jgi:hypothetical protein